MPPKTKQGFFWGEQRWGGRLLLKVVDVVDVCLWTRCYVLKTLDLYQV